MHIKRIHLVNISSHFSIETRELNLIYIIYDVLELPLARAKLTLNRCVKSIRAMEYNMVEIRLLRKTIISCFPGYQWINSYEVYCIDRQLVGGC